MNPDNVHLVYSCTELLTSLPASDQDDVLPPYALSTIPFKISSLEFFAAKATVMSELCLHAGSPACTTATPGPEQPCRLLIPPKNSHILAKKYTWQNNFVLPLSQLAIAVTSGTAAFH